MNNNISHCREVRLQEDNNNWAERSERLHLIKHSRVNQANDSVTLSLEEISKV